VNASRSDEGGAYGERSASESDAKKDRESIGRTPENPAHHPFLESDLNQRENGRWGTLGIMREFNPVSWFHARGIYRVLARLKPRLPDVGGKLFLTFTVNPALFADPLAAFEHARDRLRRIFFKLRRGVTWQGKRYVVNAPYAVKVEFHQSGWAHFHVIFLTRSYVPGGLLNELWTLGRTNVRRITDEKFRYLLKYVTKGGGLPEWVLGRTRLRVFQSSRGFLAALPATERTEAKASTGTKTHTCTLGERLQRWRKTAVFESGKRFQQVILTAPFFELVAELIFPAAVEGRYLGGGRFQINDVSQLEPWIT
jgi:hypothetical protein